MAWVWYGVQATGLEFADVDRTIERVVSKFVDSFALSGLAM